MTHQRKISVTGLGYVGLTIASAFGQNEHVYGYDVSDVRIEELKKSYDRNGEISSEQLKKSDIQYTTDPNILKEADFHIVAVPTPVDKTNHPDLSMLKEASATLGKYIKKGDCVVYESSVYPGVTEEVCIPLLEKSSNLVCGKDFSVGFSPERVNPGDKVHTITNTVKVVSGIDAKTVDLVSSVYETVIKAGVYRATSIKVAEATKIVENTQRDLNISLMNEVAIILHHFNLNITDVLAAASTKWNFINFKPGLVGGHCIGINAYYLAHKALEAGYSPKFIMAGQEVNEYMIKYIVEQTIKNLVELEIPIKKARVGVLGITYKENYPDFHDSKVMDLIDILTEHGLTVLAHDPIANYEHATSEFDINLVKWDQLTDLDAVILAVPHKQYHELQSSDFKKILKGKALIMDIKGILSPAKISIPGIRLWQI